jgi:hypothetical protein
MGQGGGEAAPPAGGKPTAAAVIVATTILLFFQIFISRPRNKGGVTGQARNLLANAVPIVVPRGTLVSRCVNHVCSSSIATLNVKGIIGRSTNNFANNVQPSYATWRYSRTLRPRKIVPSAFYQCRAH